MDKFIAKIGKGQRGAKDLTWEEARQAFRLLIEGQASPVQIGAFLMAMRIKLEAVPELAAFTITARDYIPAFPVSPALNVVDLPIYGEKHRTHQACLAAALVAASAGATIVIHSLESPVVPLDAPRVLASLGIPTDAPLLQLASMLEDLHFGYVDLALYFPPLARLIELRRELGVQHCLYQVAQLLNPSRARSQVLGITHPPYLEKLTEAGRMLGVTRVLVLLGVEGYPELSLSTETFMRELRDGRISPVKLAPKDLGFSPGPYHDMTVTAHDSSTLVEREAEWIRQLLHNQLRGPQRNWVVMNAGLLLYASGVASSVAAGIPLAQRSLESGAAAHTLSRLRAWGSALSRTPQPHMVHA